MIQFNLLPDVKLEYMRAKRLKTILTLISVLVASFSLVIVMILLAVTFAQKNNIKELDEDIATAAKTVQETKNLNRILTVQNQLQSLSDVHSKKPAATRLFDYLSKTTPVGVTLSSTKVDLVSYTISFTGQSPDLLSINRYVDILKFTTFTEGPIEGETAEAAEAKPAFTQVVLSGFATGKEETTFQINVNYSPEIFDNQKQITLIIPKGITTRSQQNFQQNTDVLFKEDPNLDKEVSDE
jgi:Tfp pilus assembly protein PilN